MRKRKRVLDWVRAPLAQARLSAGASFLQDALRTDS